MSEYKLFYKYDGEARVDLRAGSSFDRLSPCSELDAATNGNGLVRKKEMNAVKIKRWFKIRLFVTPAKAGIHVFNTWISAFAEMTIEGKK